QRALQGQKIYHANVLSSLREKYGKESGTSPMVANDQQLTDMWWILDEQGHQLRLPPPQSNYGQSVDMVGACAGTFSGSWFAPNNLEPRLSGPSLERFDWCYSAGIGIHAQINREEIVSGFTVEIFNVALAMRSARAEMAFVNNVGQRQ